MGIRTSDAVELRLESFYPCPTLASFTLLFQSLSTGSEYVVYRAAILGQTVSIPVSAAIVLLGVIMLCMSLYARAMRHRRAADYCYLSALVLVSGLWGGG